MLDGPLVSSGPVTPVCPPLERPSGSELLVSSNGGVRVVACPHPFSSRRENYWFDHGVTIEEILETVQPNSFVRQYANIHVWIEDWIIPEKNFHLVRPNDGARVTIRIVPTGGGGGGKKNPLRIILTIAVLAAAIFIPPFLPL